jgi:hypothetical protein
VGGFPIERTYAEWSKSRYADRPGNRNFDPAFKRDCQTCHMQQDYGQPGTAHTLYREGTPRPPVVDRAAAGAPARTYFTHHFIGGNAYVPRIVGADTDEGGNIQPYPELSAFSFSSSDEKSVYSNAYWVHTDRRGAVTQQARLAWDRLRNVLDLSLSGLSHAAADTRAPIRVSVTNSGSGHNFPTGFPEGRVAWLAVRATDLASGRQLDIYDAFWKRTSRGVGGLTRKDTIDPNFPGCGWRIPAGSPDPYAYQFKAVASQGDGCPTLDLVYAAPLNLVTNARGLPIDANNVVIDRNNPNGLPQFRDLNGNGDLYDDAFLRDTRLRPLPNGGATVSLDRYAVVIPPGTAGPVAVTAAVYYQSVEAIVARKFLGNLADTDVDFVLEPCVLDGPCDGRAPTTEPAVVEGAPPVPVEVRSWTIQIDGGRTDRTSPRVVGTYPQAGAKDVYQDVVVKAFFSRPVRGVNGATFTLVDSRRQPVPASVEQIGDGTWALFSDATFLDGGATYTARLAAGICDDDGGCTRQPLEWRFTTARVRGEGLGDTSVPIGFAAELPPPAPEAPIVTAVALTSRAAGVSAVFSKPVMNVTPLTFLVWRAGAAECSPADRAMPGHVASTPAADAWTFTAERQLAPGDYCVLLTTDVYDLTGRNLSKPFSARLRVGEQGR